MRLTSAIAAVALLLAPAAFADLPAGDWSGETTITVTTSSMTTITLTKTLVYANATSSAHTSHSSGWNVTSTAASTRAATTVNKPSLTTGATSSTQSAVVIASATGAASVQDINLAVAALAGAAAMVWGSL